MNTELHDFLINHKFKYDEFDKTYEYYKSEHDDNDEISKIKIFRIHFIDYLNNSPYWAISYCYIEHYKVDIEFTRNYPKNYQITIKDIEEIISFFKINFV